MVHKVFPLKALLDFNNILPHKSVYELRVRTRTSIFSPNRSERPSISLITKRIIAMDFIYKKNPRGVGKTGERLLLKSRGLGEQSITFDVTDSSLLIYQRIIQVFPILSTLKEGIRMWETLSGNSLDLVSMGPPIVDGFLLKASTCIKIFVAPLLNERLEASPALTGIEGECTNCSQDMDLSL